MNKNNKIFVILALLKYFSNNDIIIQHKGIVFSNDSLFKELTWIENFSPNKFSDLKIIINRKDLKWKINDDELYFPIFPPLNSKYYNLYLKIINLTGAQINIFIYDQEKYQKIKKNSLLINGIYFTGIEDILKDYIREAKWKKKSYLEMYNYHDYMDLISFVFYNSIFYKFLIKNKNINNTKKYIINIIEFFKGIEKKFSSDRFFSGTPGNLKIENKYIGIARFLDRDNLKVKKDYYNNFDKGDIIIGNNTSVHFMDFILKAGGIITINNNRLSHASIVSRELGLPLVLGLKDLFFRVFDGDLIEIDSKNGTVKILKRFWELS